MPDLTLPTIFTLTPDQFSVLRILTPISASIGLLGALTTITGFFIFSRFHTTIARIIVFMAVSDFFAIFAKALGRLGPNFGDNSILCQLQAALQQWGDLSSILWTAMISLNLILIMYIKKAVEDVQRYEKWYIILCYGLPVPLAILPLFISKTNLVGKRIPVYSDSGLWCWIAPEYNIERIALFYGPLWTFFIFNLVTYALVGRVIWRTASRILARGPAAIGANYHKYTFGKNTSLYLVAFLITWTPSTINRLYSFVYPGRISYSFSILMAICSPARGLTNCAVYFYLSWLSQVQERRQAVAMALVQNESRRMITELLLTTGNYSREIQVESRNETSQLTQDTAIETN